MADEIYVGRRKSAVARVRLRPGSGEFALNGRGLEDYFRTEKHRHHAVEPLAVVEQQGRWDVVAHINGGG
ncbi:MAG: 30S ribosomal protein S9, partial [Actinomycetota bacterium]|nr:30S ribosomal protein S9 [Actinomycetota bacterium]